MLADIFSATVTGLRHSDAGWETVTMLPRHLIVVKLLLLQILRMCRPRFGFYETIEELFTSWTMSPIDCALFSIPMIEATMESGSTLVRLPDSQTSRIYGKDNGGAAQAQ
jgi:hypothetical protein